MAVASSTTGPIRTQPPAAANDNAPLIELLRRSLALVRQGKG